MNNHCDLFIHTRLSLSQTRTCVGTYIHTYMHTYTYTYIHTYIHTHIHTYIHTYTYTYIHTYIHTYTYTYIHTCIHIYINAYIYSDCYFLSEECIYSFVHYTFMCTQVTFQSSFSLARTFADVTFEISVVWSFRLRNNFVYLGVPSQTASRLAYYATCRTGVVSRAPWQSPSSTSSFDHCLCDLRWFTKPAVDKRRCPQTLHFSSFVTSADTALSSCFRSAHFNSACFTRFRLKLMSFLQGARFFVKASQSSTSISSSFWLFFNTSLTVSLACAVVFSLK